MKRKITLFAAIIFAINISAQEKQKDTINGKEELSEVVVTGQFEPQSIKKSVFNVTVISRKDIEQQAANNLADLLNQYLNITITPSSGTGRSTVSMFGLNGEYFKILIDNIPVVSDTSLGNNVDLTQINLDDIEQIEIIEGSMGVTNGANAVTGVLNIITKKSSRYKWEIGATVQEETVGEEYTAFNKGRHIQSLKVSHSINDNWFISGGLDRNDLDGYLGGKKGEYYSETDLQRGYTWLPKLQYIGNGMISYKKNSFRAFYKFDYLNENIDYYNPIVNVVTNPPFDDIRYSSDKRFLTERIINHLNFYGKLASQYNYNVSFSQQKQTRSTDSFEYNIKSRQESEGIKQTNQSTELFYSTGTLGNFFPEKAFDFQLGYEYVNNLGYSLVNGENESFVPVEKRFENYDVFLSSEIKATKKFSIRPGGRISFQNQFDNQYAASVGLYYLFDKGIEMRTSLGRGFRTPNFDELYSKIKFSGHQFYGNDALIPETSMSYDFSIKKMTSFESGLLLSTKLSTSFLNVNDKIDMAYVGDEPGTTQPIYQYINISTYKMWNAAVTNQINFKNLSFNLGASLVGISQKIDNGKVVSDDQFLYALQINSSITYNLSKYNTLFAVNYKFNGEQQQFRAVKENGLDVYRLSTLESYSFLDASVRKTFNKKAFDVTIGARNILDVTNIQQSLASGAAHATSNNILLGYGRSYYLKLTYNLNL
ncbi:TonB-dependent receptor [Flavobacterium sp. Fl-318]|uniref:TonB-dependent receptor n=1 Tax=Flavobacterium cupriresistens TaxID=2893885 RepID=A0ABU4RF40_9FLAO|nr:MULTISPECIES: TonB-dependent receptor [unclassified Flavobacterium]MDX6190035.1 TonB-dependent receptor [Flavobacterium sp. Fl-318]UFH42859.1 TonB-dependent receptor [Flavobacterium sp. F-323]